MAIKFFVIALALVCVAQARTLADAPATTNNLDSFFNDLQGQFDAVSKNVGELFGIKDSDDLIKNVRKAADDVAAGINNSFKQFQENIAKTQPEVNKALKPFQDKVNSIVAQLQKENPEATASAKKIKANLDEAVAKITDEAKKFGDSIKDDPTGLRSDLKKFVEQSLENASKVTKDLKDTIDKNNKKP